MFYVFASGYYVTIAVRTDRTSEVMMHSLFFLPNAGRVSIREPNYFSIESTLDIIRFCPPQPPSPEFLLTA